MKIISFLSQKGGVGKSTLARGVAVEFVKNNWDVHIADMDTTQLSTLKWAQRRDDLNIKPSIDVATYRNPKSALRAAKTCDLLVIDGTPYATSDTKLLAQESNLVVIPTGITCDDLEPSLKLGQELTISSKLSRQQILYIVMKVPEYGNKESILTQASIKDWSFNVVDVCMPFKTTYGTSMDSGYSMSETRFNSLNQKAGSILTAIANKLNGDNE